MKLGVWILIVLCGSSCTHANTNKESVTAKNSIDKLLREFSSSKSRVQSRDRYLETLNTVIKDVGFGYLLNCLDSWEKEGGEVRIQFLDPNSDLAMHIKTHYEFKKPLVEIVFDLETSVQRVLPTYMHELLHVCQQEESRNLEEIAYKRYIEAPSLSAYEDVNRNAYFKEIASTNLALKAYQKLVSLDPRMSEDDPPNLYPRSPSLSAAYKSGAEDFTKGIFAQRVIWWYLNGPLKNTPLGIFDESSLEINYPGSQIEGPFKMKRLNSRLKNKIERIGIPVKEVH